MDKSLDQTSRFLQQAQKAMQAGQFAQAAQQVAQCLADQPEHVDALYMAAVCARYLKDYAAAEAHLAALKNMMPDYGRAFQEEGHLRLAQDRPALALAAFQAATRCNPALTASWDALARLFRATGRSGEAAQAAAQSARLKALPRELLAV